MAAIPQGAIRFNTDSQKLEFYAQDQWWEMVTDTPNLGVGADTTAGARGVIGGGVSAPGAKVNTIEYINISSTGNTQDFGDLSVVKAMSSAVASNTRAVFAGGYTPSSTNTIEYITITSTGEAKYFGDLPSARYAMGSVSNSTRGIFGAGVPDPATNAMNYITIASTGDAKDFGDLIPVSPATGIYSTYGNIQSPTRGIFSGGRLAPNSTNTIQFVIISTLGDAQDFGDLSVEKEIVSACSNPIRGIIAGGNSGPGGAINTMEYITISTLGNAQNFGDLSVPSQFGSAASSSTRGVFHLGETVPAGNGNILEYITIQTQGNSVDFGDMSANLQRVAGCSNAHGGL